uniref:Uncharacterized protein n=1 Tax=Photinus pyralis TaxID=7054 RepID=A0A1Y1LL88_PHOPY
MHNSENGASAVRHRSPEVQSPENKEHFLVAEKNEDLLQWKDMPKHLQFNPYIFTGYRPLLSVVRRFLHCYKCPTLVDVPQFRQFFLASLSCFIARCIEKGTSAN